MAGVFYAATSRRYPWFSLSCFFQLWLVVFQLPPDTYFCLGRLQFGLESELMFRSWWSVKKIWRTSTRTIWDWFYGIFFAKPFRLCQYRRFLSPKQQSLQKSKLKESTQRWYRISIYIISTKKVLYRIRVVSLRPYFHLLPKKRYKQRWSIFAPSVIQFFPPHPNLLSGSPKMSRLWWIWDRRWIRIRALWSTSAQVH